MWSASSVSHASVGVLTFGAPATLSPHGELTVTPRGRQTSCRELTPRSTACGLRLAVQRRKDHARTRRSAFPVEELLPVFACAVAAGVLVADKQTKKQELKNGINKDIVESLKERARSMGVSSDAIDKAVCAENSRSALVILIAERLKAENPGKKSLLEAAASFQCPETVLEANEAAWKANDASSRNTTVVAVNQSEPEHKPQETHSRQSVSIANAVEAFEVAAAVAGQHDEHIANPVAPQHTEQLALRGSEEQSALACKLTADVARPAGKVANGASSVASPAVPCRTRVTEEEECHPIALDSAADAAGPVAKVANGVSVVAASALASRRQVKEAAVPTSVSLTAWKKAMADWKKVPGRYLGGQPEANSYSDANSMAARSLTKPADVEKKQEVETLVGVATTVPQKTNEYSVAPASVAPASAQRPSVGSEALPEQKLASRLGTMEHKGNQLLSSLSDANHRVAKMNQLLEQLKSKQS